MPLKHTVQKLFEIIKEYDKKIEVDKNILTTSLGWYLRSLQTEYQLVYVTTRLICSKKAHYH